MKVLFFLAAMACMSTQSHAVDEKPPPEAAVVKIADKPIPPEKDEQEKFLWDAFLGKPDEQIFESYTTENWKKTFAAFAASLTKKAADQGLDSVSLGKALDFVLAHAESNSDYPRAYLPVGAYQTSLGGKSVWVISVKWEETSMIIDGKSPTLTHVRAFVFDQKSLKLVGFTTCG